MVVVFSHATEDSLKPGHDRCDYHRVERRQPLEGVFAWLNQRARYRGTIKNQFQALIQAFAYNLKRLIKIETDPIALIEV